MAVHMKNRIGLFVALLLATVGVQAATFNLFQPAAGILKGNPSTYITTAAVSSDVIATFSGTCNATTWLRGDGACATPTGTSVGANPSATIGLSVVNGAAVTFMRSDAAPALSQSITPTWSGVHTFSSPPIFSSLTGPLKGNAASAVGLAASSDIIGIWSGTCNNTTFLRGDGTCAAGAGGSTANPTATIGLTAVNGVAASSIRSDGAPALSQAIVPTWTAQHIFSKVGPDLASPIFMSSTLPSIAWNQTGAAADNRLWDVAAASARLQFRAINDAGSTANNFMDVSRSGAAISKVSFPNGNVEIGIAAVPDTTGGADLGTSSLRFANTFSSTVCDGTCAAAALVDSTSTTARIANGSTWTAIALPHNTAVTGTFSASGLSTFPGGVSITNNSTLGAVMSWGGSGEIRTDNGAGTWSIKNTAGSVTYFGINNLTGEATLTGPSGTFSANLSVGCTTNPTYNFRYDRIGQVVTLTVTNSPLGCTQNTTSKQFAAGILPSNATPIAARCVAVQGVDNAIGVLETWTFQPNGSITMGGGCSGVASGTGNWVGAGQGQVFTYTVL
jgi:hypothetical protein